MREAFAKASVLPSEARMKLLVQSITCILEILSSADFVTDVLLVRLLLDGADGVFQF